MCATVVVILPHLGYSNKRTLLWTLNFVNFATAGAKYRGFAAGFGNALAILGVVRPHAVHLVRCSLSWGVPLTLLGNDVDQYRPHSLCGLDLCTS